MIRFIALFFLITSLAACNNVKQHPDFAKQWNREYSVTVVPARITLQESGVFSREKLDKTVNNVDSNIQQALERAFAQRGYKVKYADFSQILAQQPELKFQLKTLHDKTEEAVTAIRKQNSSWENLAEIEIGPVVNHFGSLTGADLIAVPQYHYIENSGGKQALGFLLGVATGIGSSMMNHTQGFINLTLVDASNTNVMWNNYAGGASSMFSVSESSDIKLADEIIENLFKTLPDKSQANPDA